MTPLSERGRRDRERGFTLLEAVAAILVLAVAASIAIGAIGSALPQSFENEVPVSAVQLARDLMDEVLSKSFDDPAGADGEMVGANHVRSGLDDIDDYGGFSESPPRDPEGVPIPGAGAYARRVVVTPIAASLPGAQTVTTRSNATHLRVEVVVSRGGADVARLTGLRADPGRIIPAARAGFVYVEGTRANNAGGGGGQGNAESVSFDVANRTAAPITVTEVRVFWSPEDTAYFRRFEIRYGGVSGSWSASGTYASEGQLLAFDSAVTVPAGGTARVEIEHFRENPNGTGPAQHVGGFAFTLIWTSGSRTYQTDIPVNN